MVDNTENKERKVGKFKGLEISTQPKFFDGLDSITPSNTPSAQKSAGVNLKSIDFGKLSIKQNEDDKQNSQEEESDDDIDKRFQMEYCESVFIGNSNHEVGLTVSKEDPKICSHLICDRCDNKVTLLRNKKWEDKEDYIDNLRSTNESSLHERLAPCEICVFFYCKCSWINCNSEIEPIESFEGKEWSCAGHK